MLRLNPDFYSLWNYRKEILISMHGSSLGLSEIVPEVKIPTEGESASCVSAASLAAAELQLSAEGIRKNPKSCKFL